MSVRVSLRGILCLIRVDTLRKVYTDGSLVGRLNLQYIRESVVRVKRLKFEKAVPSPVSKIRWYASLMISLSRYVLIGQSPCKTWFT